MLKEAYHQLAAHGQASLGLDPAMDVAILPRSNLGVEYPAVSAKHLPLQPVSLLWTDASFDETRKRVNALKYNVIPRYQTHHWHHRISVGGTQYSVPDQAVE